MKLGINYPYSCENHLLDNSLPDFGMAGDPPSYWKRERSVGGRRIHALTYDLGRMSELGINALRWFMFNIGGPAFGTPTFERSTSRWEPLINASPDFRREYARNHPVPYGAFAWRFQMPSFTDCLPFKRDFLQMLGLVADFNRDVAEHRKVRIVPTWTDYRMFLGCALQYRDSTGVQNPVELLERASREMGLPVPTGLRLSTWLQTEQEFSALMARPEFRTRLGRGSGGGGKIDILINHVVRQDFYQRLVIPILNDVYSTAGLPDQVLFWDIGNELDALATTTIASLTSPSPTQVDALTLSMHRFVCEMIQLHSGQETSVYTGSGWRTLDARTGGRARTTVGWLWCGDDGERGLCGSIEDRALFAGRGDFNIRPAVEDVLQYHAYVSSHQDRTRPAVLRGPRQHVMYLPEQFHDISFYQNLHWTPTFPNGQPRTQLMHCLGTAAAPRPPCNLYDGANEWAMSFSGWRQFPRTTTLLSLVHTPPFETRTTRECIIGELALAAFDGTEGGVPPERWVYHFSVPWAVRCLGTGRQSFAVRVARFNNSTPTDPQYETEPESLGELFYSARSDRLENRLLLLQMLGYTWAFPWSWNIPGPGLFYGPPGPRGAAYWESHVAPSLRRFNRLRARSAAEQAAALREAGARLDDNDTASGGR